ncbi:MAG TPA: endonuclease/exonuclease/phosphatase family protein [Longimicrobium sp.]|nr:endonuclease/exonuclease/phosphatase family protein [Longimicrobium sp.]
MLTVLHWAVLGVGWLMAAGTLASMTRHPHWAVRMWDFPRVQMVFLAALAGGLYAALFFDGEPRQWAFLAAVALTLALQLRKIVRYTPVARAQVERARGHGDAPRFRLLISNVLMENTEHDRFLRAVRAADPDLVLAVEVDDAWNRAIQPLAKDYPHEVRRPQDNWYGMVLFSRLPLVDPRIDFLVQDDIPSVHTEVELPGGARFVLHGLHPRPPEPIRDQSSTPRDAELVLVGRAIGDGPDTPTVVAGDLNDVAWSRTTELFLRLSGLLDPRVGRGMFNSYNAKNPLFRYPLDHVFHSSHFRLVRLRRLPGIGSDHFPMLVELSYEPDATATQDEPDEKPGDEREAAERLQEQAEAAATGADRPKGE